MRYFLIALIFAADCAVMFWAWVHFEMRKPAHTHDEGDHEPNCPGCFAEKVKR